MKTEETTIVLSELPSGYQPKDANKNEWLSNGRPTSRRSFFRGAAYAGAG